MYGFPNVLSHLCKGSLYGGAGQLDSIVPAPMLGTESGVFRSRVKCAELGGIEAAESSPSPRGNWVVGLMVAGVSRTVSARRTYSARRIALILVFCQPNSDQPDNDSWLLSFLTKTAIMPTKISRIPASAGQAQ